MPMPLSATASSTQSRPSATLRTRSATSPSFVNLQALLKRLSRICFSRMESAVSAPTFSCASTTRRFWLVAHAGEELRFALARLRQLAALVLDFIEQPYILDRDCRLVGERLDERDLLVSERFEFQSVD